METFGGIDKSPFLFSISTHILTYIQPCVYIHTTHIHWQMIRKSVETRDWLNTIEPRNIRSVMKRVVEEVTLIDRQVGTLYEDGLRKEQGSGESLINQKVHETG